MSNDKTFAKGVIVKPRGNAPQWVLAKVSIKVDEFIQTLQQYNKNGWLNIDLKVSAGGKAYAEIDTWEPNGGCSGYTTKQTNQMPQRQAPPPPPFPTGQNVHDKTPPPAGEYGDHNGTNNNPQNYQMHTTCVESGDESIDDIPF